MPLQALCQNQAGNANSHRFSRGKCCRFLEKGLSKRIEKRSKFHPKSCKNGAPGPPGPPPESQIGVKFRKVASGAVPSEFFFEGSRFRRLSGRVFSVFELIWGPPGDPKNRPGGGHGLDFGVQEGSQDAIFCRFGEKRVSDMFFDDFRLQKRVKNTSVL